MKQRVYDETYNKVYEVAKSFLGKQERNQAFDDIIADFIETIPEEEQDAKAAMAQRYFHDVQYDAIRTMILNERIRLDEEV